MPFTSLLAASLAWIGLAAHQDPPSQQAPDIVVEGIRPSDSQIRRFIDAMARAPGADQMSRFDLPVCPQAAGLTPSHNSAIENRLRRVAGAAGIRVAPAGCAPNVIVVVTRDKSEVIKQLRRVHPGYFPDRTRPEYRRLSAPGAVAAWHVEGRLTHRGEELREGFDKQVFEVTSDPHHGASRIAVSSHPHFLASVVVVEMNAVSGLSTTQLADYAAMRAFARTDPARLKDLEIPTILTALDTPVGEEVPVTLTQWDLSYLKALYATPINQLAAQQRGDIRRQLGEYLQGGKP